MTIANENRINSNIKIASKSVTRDEIIDWLSTNVGPSKKIGTGSYAYGVNWSLLMSGIGKFSIKIHDPKYLTMTILKWGNLRDNS